MNSPYVSLDRFPFEPLAWQQHAACKPGFTELPPLHQQTICKGCPVRTECQLYGLDDPSLNIRLWRRQAGIVYGGLTMEDLAELKGLE